MTDKTKADLIIEMYDEGGVSQKDIAGKVDCTEGYVSKVIGVYNKKVKDAKETEETEDNEIETDVSSFIKQVKIVPDPDVLTDKKDDPETENEEYQCGGCGHVWVAGKTEYQRGCPKCGEEFD